MVSKAKLVAYAFTVYCVVVWLVSVYGKIWGQLEKSTPPPKVEGVLAFYISQTTSRWLLSLSLIHRDNYP